MRLRRAVALLAACSVAGGCAKEEPPPGNLPDNRPPMVREVRPERGSVVPGFDGSLRIRFDEPIQLSGAYEREIEGSPAYRYRVDFGHSDIRIRPEGGWREGVVYHFRLPPNFSDLLNNRRVDPVRVTFSTGPELSGTHVEGRLRDRVEARALVGGRVLFLSLEGDSVPYTAVSDTGGYFSLEHLPPGSYRAVGFDDLNRNRAVDPRREPHDTARFELAAPGARVSLLLRALPADSTPPALAAIRPVDSVTVRFELDDPVDSREGFRGAVATVTDTASGARWSVRSLEPSGSAIGPGPGAGAPGGGVGDTAAVVDTTPPVRPDTSRAAGRAGREETGDRPATPTRQGVVRLDRPLDPGDTYRLEVTGVVNLRGLSGGGKGLFSWEPPEETGEGGPAAGPDSAARGAADTAAVGVPDTASAGPTDTTAAGGTSSWLEVRWGSDPSAGRRFR